MKKDTKRWIFGFLFVGALGTLFHFAYEFFGKSDFAGLFFPINESIWEHLKLLFFPVVLWWVIEWFWGGREPRFFAARVWALSVAMGAIPVLYYTYSGIIGRRFSAVDIGIFFISVGLYFWLAHGFGKKEEESEGENILSAIVFLTILLSLWTFTFFPPDLAIFRNP